MSFKGLSIFSFGSHYFQHTGTIFGNSGRSSLKEHFCEIILKSVHWSRRRCHLWIFSCFSFGGHFVQWSQTILTNLVEVHPKNISPLVQEEMSFKGLFFSFCCFRCHFIQWILAILVEGLPKNISVKLFSKSVYWSRRSCL